jgi:CRISPR/Cas system-associated endonuclease Cas3-HD
MVSNILQKKEKNSKEKQNLLNKIEKEIKNIENIKLKLEKLLTIYQNQYDKILVIKMFRNKIPQKNRNKINGDEKKIEKKIINTLKEIKYLLENLLKLTNLKRDIIKNMNKPLQNFISVHFRNTIRNGNRR